MPVSTYPTGASGPAKVKVFYCDIPNAGDQFNVDLFLHYGHVAELVSPQEAEVIACGSILGWPEHHYAGAIMGAGFMIPECGNTFNRAEVHAVRGKLTRSRVCRSLPVLGDPGLLASYIYESSEPEYALGVIPHFLDAGSPAIRNLVACDSRNLILIDITQSPVDVIRQLTKCGAIVSSSLHGLIFADSFGIPSVWMSVSDKVTGEGFKFRDYYSVFRECPNPLGPSDLHSVSAILNCTRRRPESTLKEIMDHLARLFDRLPEIVATVRVRRRNLLRQTMTIIRNRFKSIEFEESLLSPELQHASRSSIPSALRWLP